MNLVGRADSTFGACVRMERAVRADGEADRNAVFRKLRSMQGVFIDVFDRTLYFGL